MSGGRRHVYELVSETHALVMLRVLQVLPKGSRTHTHAHAHRGNWWDVRPATAATVGLYDLGLTLGQGQASGRHTSVGFPPSVPKSPGNPALHTHVAVTKQQLSMA